MSNLDSTTVTIIIAVAAFISPVITAALNVWLQLHMKKLELRECVRSDAIKYSRDIYECYLRKAGECIKGNKWSALAAYGDAFALAYAYAPEDIRELMLKLDSAIATGDRVTATKPLPEVSSIVANVLYHPEDHVGRKHKHAVYSE